MPYHVCPICKKRFEYESVKTCPTLPFCSERCRLIDLGKWLDKGYAIPGSEEEDGAKPDEEEK